MGWNSERDKKENRLWLDREIGGFGGGGDCGEPCSNYKFLIDKYCCEYGSPGTGLLDLMEPEAIYSGFVRPVAGLMHDLAGLFRAMIRLAAKQSGPNAKLVKVLDHLDPDGNFGILPQLAPPDDGVGINGASEQEAMKTFRVSRFDLDENPPDTGWAYHKDITEIYVPDVVSGLLSWTRFCETLVQVQTYYGDLLQVLVFVFGDDNLPPHVDQDIMRYLAWPVYMPRSELKTWIEAGQALFL